jgi:hypothetical protein
MTLCVLVSNTRKHSMITQENIQWHCHLHWCCPKPPALLQG